jgi:excisionase family DNA binding protein
MNTQIQIPGGQPQPAAHPPMAMGVATVTPTPPAPEGYIDKVEVAQRLGKTVRCIDNWMKRGLIPFFKIGRTVSFKWSDVEAHLSDTCRVCRRKL